MSITTNPYYSEKKDFRSSRNKFIWLNSHGALLKGLDIVIDLFLTLNDSELYVCGNLNRDILFYDYYQKKVNNSRNIFFLNWVDTNSSEFKGIVDKCAFVIGSSFSEGGGGSILNLMAMGLIPIITDSVSIDLPEKTGFYFDQNDIKSFFNVLDVIRCCGDDQLASMSKNSYQFIIDNHLLEHFKDSFRNFLRLQKC